MIKFFKKNGKTLLATTIIFVSLVLAVFSIVLLESFSIEMQTQAKNQVELNAERMGSLIRDNITTYESKALLAAQLVKHKVETEQDFVEGVYRLPENEELKDLKFARYFHEGEIFFYGSLYLDESQTVLSMMDSKTVMTSAPFFESEYSMYLVGVYAPINDCEFADGIVLYFPLSAIYNINLDFDDSIVTNSELLVLATRDGDIYKVYGGEGVYEHSNVLTILREKTNDPEIKGVVSNIVNSDKSDILELSINLVPYVLAIQNVSEHGGQYQLIFLYQSEQAYDEGYGFVNAILGTLIVFFVVLIGFATYSIINTRRTEKQIAEIGMTDLKFDCPTQKRYEKEALEILYKHKGTNFAIINAEIKHYKFFFESFGSVAVDGLIKYILVILSKAMQIDELYAYAENGTFLLLLHYRDTDNLAGRLKIMNALLSKYSGFSTDRSYTPQMAFGIYLVKQQANLDVHHMIGLAIEARMINKVRDENDNYRFFDDNVHKDKVEESNLELKMDAALKNKEFRIFYQPKYNMAKRTIDGSEALVRWYDPIRDIYNSPGLFMPLFEANGFVEKLDKYVYENVCSYISDCFANNLKVYPVSVNVSRVTASKPDFCDFYIAIKNKYGIRNHFITIEFTESFAYEDYDTLKSIVERLHKNGFHCSIDDFGVGFSSYNTLKQLEMDEIKLDMFFLKKGISQKRDDDIISSVAVLAKSLGMKITQEGVETQEELSRMKKNGIDVIQGYFYSRPLALSDFVQFIDVGGKPMNPDL